MKVTAPLCFLSAAASATTVSYDIGYDDKSRPLAGVSCSDGANGLITNYGWQTIGNIPEPNFVGGFPDIAGWNSDVCGQCYQVTYKETSIFVLGIDGARGGLNLSKGAMDALTTNQATELGRVEATVTKVGVSKCGLTPKRDAGIEFNA